MAEAPEAEQQRLEAILAAMSDAVLVVAPDGQRLLTNAAYDRLLGDLHALRPEDELGQPMPEALWPQRRAARGESFTLLFTLRDRDHGRRWFEALGQPLVIGGVRHGGVIVIRDVSDRSLRRIQEQFLATAGHELRTPLTALSLSLDLAARRSARGDDDRLRQHIDRALEQAHRLSALVVELVDVVRLQTATMQLQREPTDLTAQARAAIETARIIAADQPIALHSGHDRGPGIPAAALPRIFDRVFRVDSEQAPAAGLGLGWFIASEIVTAHGGTIAASSGESGGARFVVRLPLAVDDEQFNETPRKKKEASSS
jgi:two-component system, chemotaxis family, CheB/CheR fusion protein